MRERTTVIYDAFDGTEHETAEACLKYEKDNAWRRLIGLTEQQVLDALGGVDERELAEAMVTVGYRIAGISKRKATPKPNPADKEPFLPDPIGGPDGGPPAPPEDRRPMTAEEALNHTRP